MTPEEEIEVKALIAGLRDKIPEYLEDYAVLERTGRILSGVQEAGSIAFTRWDSSLISKTV